MKRVFLGGKLYMPQGEAQGHTAILVQDGRIVCTGSDEEILDRAGGEAEVIALEGAFVYPGFADTHLHILGKAITDSQLHLEDAKSREDVIRMVAQRAKTLPEGTPVDGRGFNESLWPDQGLFTRRDLDRAAPRNPVRLSRVCGHLVIANTLALNAGGIFPDTPSPEGSTIDYENGFVTEAAVSLLYRQDRDPGVEHCMETLLRGLSYAADLGLTHLYSDDLTAGAYDRETVAEAYRRLRDEHRMPLRVVEQCALADEAELEDWLRHGHTYFSGDDWFRIGPRKLYADGSLGAATAWLSRPYADRPETRGVAVCSQEEMNALFVSAHEKGYPCIVHAIGDAAAQCVLNAAEHAKKTVPGTEDLPDGIVHCQITTPDILKKIRELNMCVYAQPVFCEYDLHICRDRVGEALESTSYAWKTLLDSGVRISAGSDCPVEDCSPAGNIYCACERTDYQGFPEGGWLPGEKLTRQEAIGCHTTLAAASVGLQDRFGRIAPGYYADFTVYTASVEGADAAQLLHMRPKMTVVDGRIRYPGGEIEEAR